MCVSFIRRWYNTITINIVAWLNLLLLLTPVSLLFFASFNTCFAFFNNCVASFFVFSTSTPFSATCFFFACLSSSSPPLSFNAGSYLLPLLVFLLLLSVLPALLSSLLFICSSPFNACAGFFAARAAASLHPLLHERVAMLLLLLCYLQHCPTINACRMKTRNKGMASRSKFIIFHGEYKGLEIKNLISGRAKSLVPGFHTTCVNWVILVFKRNRQGGNCSRTARTIPNKIDIILYSVVLFMAFCLW